MAVPTDPPSRRNRARLVWKAAPTRAADPLKWTRRPFAETDPTASPSARSWDETAAIDEPVGPNSRAKPDGVMNRWYRAEPGVDTAVANDSSPAGSRDFNATAPVTRCEAATAPISCIAPRRGPAATVARPRRFACLAALAPAGRAVNPATVPATTAMASARLEREPLLAGPLTGPAPLRCPDPLRGPIGR